MSATFWPWWAGSISLAAVVGLSWLGMRRLLGVSGALSNALARKSTLPFEPDAVDMAALEAELMRATMEEFGESAAAQSSSQPAPTITAPQKTWLQRLSPVPWTAYATMLVGIVLGSTLASSLHGRFKLRWDFGAEFSRLFGQGLSSWALLVVGGVMVGFGTQMAGGCTSGHGLCGNATLQRGSMLATMCFFGTAVLVSLALDRVMQ